MEPPIRKISAGVGSNREGRDRPDQYPHLRDGRRSCRHPDFPEADGSTEKEVDVVKFEAYFVKRHNHIFERAKFNQRKEEEGELVDSFITALHCLAEYCGYGELHDEMIMD